MPVGCLSIQVHFLIANNIKQAELACGGMAAGFFGQTYECVCMSHHVIFMTSLLFCNHIDSDKDCTGPLMEKQNPYQRLQLNDHR